ncbi:YT521-B-like domain-containing protein [Ganoderma leucocontextum]|nr:YT521-B-like domain-containing protein [Ganoderma leucocontextum]
MSYSPVNTREVEQTQYGQPGSSPVTPNAFHISPPHPPGPSPGPISSQGHNTPIAPSPQVSPYSQRIGETSQMPQQRERPPDTGPISPNAATSRSGADRPPPIRRPYHPNPPAHRSEWVMWAGNLWRFFNSPPSPGSGSGDSSAGALSVGAQSTQSAPAGPVGSSRDSWAASSPGTLFGGVSSIFLITRSNCAFVNFTTEAHLHAAVMHFNGAPLRAGDTRSPRLVCRVRGREDDLKAGVGAQRGAGVHVRWVKDKKEREREEEAQRHGSAASESDPSSSSPTDPAHLIGRLSLSSDEEGAAGAGRRVRRPEPHSSSSGSYASTSSSILTVYFPKRYFILKSLTQFDLDLSVEKGLWATQRHNEGILDQAFRTSKEVYLIFSVNKSGEFYGYAKMVGPVMRGEARVSWASRTDSLQRRSAQHRDSGSQRESTFLSPGEHRFGESPYPLSPEQTLKTPTSSPSVQHQPSQQQDRNAASAPAEMLQPHRVLSQATMDEPQAFSYDHQGIRPVAPAIAGLKQLSQPEGIELDRMAPIRAIRDPLERVSEAARAVSDGALQPVAEEDERPHDRTADADADAGKEKAADQAGAAQDDGPVWGESFKVEWVRTERLPFTRTRHLRNPWNHDREVKVSRDGTELEPSVGQMLLEEWDKVDQPPQAQAAGGNADGKASISADVLSPPGGT